MHALRPYFLVMQHSVQDVLEYRVDFFVHVFKYALLVLMAALVWVAVGQSNPNLNLDTADTITYFFFGAMLYSLTSFHTWYIEDDIRLGGLAKYLLKPISAFGYYFSFEAGVAFLETFLKFGVMIPLLYLLGYRLDLNWLHVLVFASFLPLIFTYSFHQFGLISGMTFWIHEAWAIRWSLTVVIRFLAGLLVPLTFFPETARNILMWTPFPHLIFTPIRLLQNQLSLQQALQGWLILLAWTITLFCLRWWQWHLGTHHFEGTGQ